MKYIYALLALGLLGTGFAHAKTETEKEHIIRKKSIYKKAHKTRAKPAKKEHYRRINSKPKSPYKNVTKRAVTPAAATAAATTIPVAAATQAPVATPKTTEPTAYQRLGSWLGLGAGAGATAAATTSVASHHKVAGYHTGPRKEKWNHKFESYWGNRRFEEGLNQYGHWVFGSYRPDWWEKNYPIYYKDVVGPLYRKSAEYQKIHSK